MVSSFLSSGRLFLAVLCFLGGRREWKRGCEAGGLQQLPSSTTSPTLSTTSFEDSIRFYIYPQPVFRPPLCFNPMYGDSYTFFYSAFLKQLYKHRWRTGDPEEAEIFIVPFDTDLSHDASRPSHHSKSYDGMGQALCQGKAHSDRLRAAVDVLRASPYFQLSQGADHYWGMGLWQVRDLNPDSDAYFPYDQMDVLSEMMVGHIMNARVSLVPLPPATKEPHPKRFNWFDFIRDYWRCTVSMPILVDRELFRDDESFEEWNARPIGLYYRGKSRDCHDVGSAIARNRTLDAAASFPNSVIERGHGDNYLREIQTAKFCLVLGCDNPQTSRFFDAIAAGCIPITINEGFRLTVAPFSRLVNYDSFTLDIQQSILIDRPELALSYILREPEASIRDLHRNLMAVRSKFLWIHPESDVATWAIRQMKAQCLPSRED